VKALTPEHQAALDARAEYEAACTDLQAGGATDEQAARVRRAAEVAAEADAVHRKAKMKATLTEWSPPFAPHVSGTWTPRTWDSYGHPEPQAVKCRCSICGEEWQTVCSSGLVREHVSRFGVVHLHREVIGERMRKLEGT
jgi:hypothetical protein